MACELLISRLGDYTWAALREQGRTVELRVEPAGSRTSVGQIVKARVAQVMPAIQVAFLDVGRERDAFLHASELLLPGELPPARPRMLERRFGAEAQGSANGTADHGCATARDTVPIESRLRPGRELLVQIIREAAGSKGDRATCYIGIPGRLLVILPRTPFRGVARRIRLPEERQRLQAALDGLPGTPVGFLARTAAAGVEEATLVAEAEHLLERWAEIEREAASISAPGLVRDELDLSLRLLRDAPADSLQCVLIDGVDEYERALRYAEQLDPRLVPSLRRHVGPRSLFEAYGLHRDVEDALRPRVELGSGGDIVIEQTEALVSIDVNTGRASQGRSQEETILRTNLEAASEIARQLRLRGLGGIIVIDFIDMIAEEHRRQVVECLEHHLAADPARTRVVGPNEFGLVELTRKRSRAALRDLMTQSCPVCAGQGRVRNPSARVEP